MNIQKESFHYNSLMIMKLIKDFIKNHWYCFEIQFRQKKAEQLFCPIDVLHNFPINQESDPYASLIV